jgi:hypothetical protein
MCASETSAWARKPLLAISIQYFMVRVPTPHGRRAVSIQKHGVSSRKDLVRQTLGT